MFVTCFLFVTCFCVHLLSVRTIQTLRLILFIAGSHLNHITPTLLSEMGATACLQVFVRLWKVYGFFSLLGRSAARAKQTYTPQERDQACDKNARDSWVTWAFYNSIRVAWCSAWGCAMTQLDYITPEITSAFFYRDNYK